VQGHRRGFALIWKTSLFAGVRYGLANAVLGLFDVDPVAWTGTVDAAVLARAGHGAAVAAALPRPRGHGIRPERVTTPLRHCDQPYRHDQL
jgi:hypothetical protein